MKYKKCPGWKGKRSRSKEVCHWILALSCAGSYLFPTCFSILFPGSIGDVCLEVYVLFCLGHLMVYYWQNSKSRGRSYSSLILCVSLLSSHIPTHVYCCTVTGPSSDEVDLIISAVNEWSLINKESPNVSAIIDPQPNTKPQSKQG